jgi:hypothetical protein
MTRREQFATDWLRRVDEELYDLDQDPNETTNLAGEASHAQTLGEMRQRLLRWMRQTQDPLLDGPVQSPHHAKPLEAFRESGPAPDTHCS